MSNTAICELSLKLADRSVCRLVRSSIKGTELPQGIEVSKKLILSSDVVQPVTYLGIAGALVTVVIPSSGAIDMVVQIGASMINFTNITWPLVLPCAVTSIQLSAHTPTEEVPVYIFQGL